MSETTCRWVGKGNPRLLRSHLDPDCPSTCPGCAPCPERHCCVCGMRDVTADGRGDDLTCATCVGQTRADITELEAMAPRIMIEATYRGVNSEAAHLAGPVADPEAWSHRATSARKGRAAHVSLIEEDDTKHPVWVLRTWCMLVEEHFEQVDDKRISVADVTAYLKAHLTRLAQDDTFAFEELARDVRQSVTYVENVLHEGEREERGEKCHMCNAKRLVKDYGTEPGDLIRWRCPNPDCGTWYSEKQYADKVKTRYVGVASELNLTDMAFRLPLIAASTIRRWASKPRSIVDGEVTYGEPVLKPCGRDESGRKLYRVSDVEALRDQGGRMTG